jgi:hypothetical protein
MTALDLVPIDLIDARRFIREHHRHNPETTGWRVGVGLSNGELRGVAVLSRPVAPKVANAEPRTAEIIRVCTVGDKNANSRLYGAMCRAAAALGYLSVITYTRPDESGASLKASGFVLDEGEYGSRPGQLRRPGASVQVNLLGESEPDTSGPKLRWRRNLGPAPLAAHSSSAGAVGGLGEQER